MAKGIDEKIKVKAFKIALSIIGKINYLICTLLIIFTCILFYPLMGKSWLTLFLIILAGFYWIYLIFFARYTLLDYTSAVVHLISDLCQYTGQRMINRIYIIFIIVFLIYFIPIGFLIYWKSYLHIYWILAVGWLLYVTFFLFSQISISRELSKPYYSNWLSEWLEKGTIEDASASSMIAEPAIKGAILGYNLNKALHGNADEIEDE